MANNTIKVDEDIFLVEKILDRRKGKTGYEYLIKWENFGSESNSWEPVENLYCHDLLRQFEEQYTRKSKKRWRENQGIGLGLSPSLNNNQKEAECEDIAVISKKTKAEMSLPIEFGEKRDWEFEKFLAEHDNGPSIRVYNDVDSFSIPLHFTYINESIVGADVPEYSPSFLSGCSCISCLEESCQCEKNSGGGLGSYDENGLLANFASGAIYECNALCTCDDTCSNRIIQKGRTVKLDLKRFPGEKGWGVIARQSIEKGSFICEYIGEIITSNEAVNRANMYSVKESCYFFDLDYNSSEENPCEFTIDASHYGNISHFINHSCNPNITVFPAFINNIDPRLHLVALFANRDIVEGEEICFDYTGLNEYTAKRMQATMTTISCQCKSPNCKKYIFK